MSKIRINVRKKRRNERHYSLGQPAFASQPSVIHPGGRSLVVLAPTGGTQGSHRWYPGGVPHHTLRSSRTLATVLQLAAPAREATAPAGSRTATWGPSTAPCANRRERAREKLVPCFKRSIFSYSYQNYYYGI